MKYSLVDEHEVIAEGAPKACASVVVLMSAEKAKELGLKPLARIVTDAAVGAHSHIGHGAILHSPTLGEHVVVGIGAIIMD